MVLTHSEEHVTSPGPNFGLHSTQKLLLKQFFMTRFGEKVEF